MKQHNNYLLVEVPEGYWCFHENSDGDIEAYPEDGGGGVKPIGWVLYKCDMPPGKYQIIGLAKDLTEEQWRLIIKNGYTNFTASGQSLLKSHSLKEENTLILKVIT